jgi:hypothetical protein
MRTNLLAGIGILAFCTLNIFYIIPTHIEEESLVLVGPRFFPKYITYGLAVLGMMLTIGTLLSSSRAGKEPRYRKMTFIVIAIAVVYVALIDFLGYVVPSVAVLFTFICIFSENISWKIFVISTLIVCVVYVFFGRFMNLMMPKGLCTPLFDFLIY